MLKASWHGTFSPMANITKRASKQLKPGLEPGESVLAAVLLEPIGTYGLGGAVRNILVNRAATQALSGAKASSADDRCGTAGQFPSLPCAIAVTSTRVVAALSNGVRYGAIEFSAPLGTVWATVTSVPFARRVEISFEDGSHFSADASKHQPYDQFLAALSAAQG